MRSCHGAHRTSHTTEEQPTARFARNSLGNKPGNIELEVRHVHGNESFTWPRGLHLLRMRSGTPFVLR